MPVESGSLAGGRVVAVIVVGRLAKVVVVGDYAGGDDNCKQESGVDDGSAGEAGFAFKEFGCDRGDEPRAGHSQAEFPGPEHEIEMILAAHLAPEGEPDFDGYEEFDNQERSEETICH